MAKPRKPLRPGVLIHTPAFKDAMDTQGDRGYKAVRDHLNSHCGFSVTTRHVQRAGNSTKKAERRRSFGVISAVAEEIETANPGSCCIVECKEVGQAREFHRAFICLKPMMNLFVSVISTFVAAIDGAYMQGEAMHGFTMLALVGQDINRKYLPLAMALADTESKENVNWFLTKVCSVTDLNREDITVFSDEGNALVASMVDVLPNVTHMMCFLHMMRSVSRIVGGAVSKCSTLLWRARNALTLVDFDKLMNLVKRENPRAYDKAIEKDPCKWALYCNRQKRLYGTQTNGKAERYNALHIRDDKDGAIRKGDPTNGLSTFTGDCAEIVTERAKYKASEAVVVEQLGPSPFVKHAGNLLKLALAIGCTGKVEFTAPNAFVVTLPTEPMAKLDTKLRTVSKHFCVLLNGLQEDTDEFNTTWDNLPDGTLCVDTRCARWTQDGLPCPHLVAIAMFSADDDIAFGCEKISKCVPEGCLYDVYLETYRKPANQVHLCINSAEDYKTDDTVQPTGLTSKRRFGKRLASNGEARDKSGRAIAYGRRSTKGKGQECGFCHQIGHKQTTCLKKKLAASSSSSSSSISSSSSSNSVAADAMMAALAAAASAVVPGPAAPVLASVVAASAVVPVPAAPVLASVVAGPVVVPVPVGASTMRKCKCGVCRQPGHRTCKKRPKPVAAASAPKRSKRQH